MRIIKPKLEIYNLPSRNNALKLLEKCGRVCYKSEDKITEDSAAKFIASIVNRGHLSVIEHAHITFKMICDRGVSHEIVRHRIASFSQESTRYCDYVKAIEELEESIDRDIEQNGIAFIRPYKFIEGTSEYKEWYEACCYAEEKYYNLRKSGITPEWARSVLPNSLKTEIVVTMNFREILLMLSLRAAKPAHPQMKEIMVPFYHYLNKQYIPEIFHSIKYDTSFEYDENIITLEI